MDKYKLSRKGGDYNASVKKKERLETGLPTCRTRTDDVMKSKRLPKQVCITQKSAAEVTHMLRRECTKPALSQRLARLPPTQTWPMNRQL